MKNFILYKGLFKNAITLIANLEKNYELAEAAFPAYANKNKFIDYLFWKRLKVPFDYISSLNVKYDILDFGFGSGVFSYMLSKEGHNVTGIDKELSPFKKVQEIIMFPNNFKGYESNPVNLQLINDKKYDFIVALDVLEHIEDLDSIVDYFITILKPNGKIIISGPTENIFYKIGRFLAGKDYTGEYHVTDIDKIKAVFVKRGEVTVLKRLVFPIVLFEIFIFEIKKNNLKL